MAGCFRTKHPNRHRHMYKGTSSPWRDAYRDRCLSRFRESRERLVDRFRRLPVRFGDCDVDVSNVVDGSKHIPEFMDEEWEALRRENDSLDDDIDDLYELQCQIYNEIMEDEEKIESEYEASMRHDDDVRDDRNCVMCPICQKFFVRHRGNVIYCNCGFFIDTEQDGLTLSYFKEQLKSGIDMHESSCTTRPQFSVMNTVGISNLLITCQICEFMFIVI